MKAYLTGVAVAALFAATGAQAQDAAPDGSAAFGIEPYAGILGGYESHDRKSEFNAGPGHVKLNGGIAEAVAGANVPLGAFFVGAEGTVSKGFNDIDWEYGVRGRAGLRAGSSGLIYASAGHMWVNGDHGFGDHHDWTYGLGVEVGPKDIGLGGISGPAGPRLRFQVDTYDFDSIRPMGGVIFHF